jgi:hypothetical protein
MHPINLSRARLQLSIIKAEVPFAALEKYSPLADFMGISEPQKQALRAFF